MRTGGQYQFKTPEDLREAAQSYFDWCVKNPIRGTRIINKDGGEEGEIETRDVQCPRPFTFEGLCEHIDITDWSQFVSQNKERDGFEKVIAWVRNKIRRNQIEGGLVGIYKENLTARLNGLKENLAVQELPNPECLPDELDEDNE